MAGLYSAASIAAIARTPAAAPSKPPAVSGEGRARSVQVPKDKAKDRATDFAPNVTEIEAGAASSLREIAVGLNGRGIPNTKGGDRSAVQVKRLLVRLT